MRVDDRLDWDDECSNYGGCRMLLCRCGEGDYFDYTNDREPDWYTGHCAWCHRKVALRHAKRIPLPVGGWRGCYCTWNHAWLDVVNQVPVLHSNENIEDVSEADVDRLRNDGVILVRDAINIIEADMQRIGIYDIPESLALAEITETAPVLAMETLWEEYVQESALDGNAGGPEAYPSDVAKAQILSQVIPGLYSLLSSGFRADTTD